MVVGIPPREASSRLFIFQVSILWNHKVIRVYVLEVDYMILQFQHFSQVQSNVYHVSQNPDSLLSATPTQLPQLRTKWYIVHNNVYNINGVQYLVARSRHVNHLNTHLVTRATNIKSCDITTRPSLTSCGASSKHIVVVKSCLVYQSLTTLNWIRSGRN